MRYFSERETGDSLRETEDISVNVWRGLLTVVRNRAADGSFGAKFPVICEDGTFVTGAHMGMFEDALQAEIPKLVASIEQSYPRFRRSIIDALQMPDLQFSASEILDLIEFCWKSMGKPIKIGTHSFFRHDHLEFDVEAGRDEFRNEVETIFRRNGIAYVLTEEGHIERLMPLAFQSILVESDFDTGDTELNRLLSIAQRKFLNPRQETRREALEALCDAWERLKTLDGQGDKKAQTKAMLDATAGTSSPKFRDALEREAKEVTDIGNSLRIRHSETSQEKLASSEHVDYLFYRLFSLIRLILLRKAN